MKWGSGGAVDRLPRIAIIHISHWWYQELNTLHYSVNFWLVCWSRNHPGRKVSKLMKNWPKCLLPYKHSHNNFWVFLVFYQIFLLPQVKRSTITSNKHGKASLPHELPNGLKLKILGNSEILGKSEMYIICKY